MALFSRKDQSSWSAAFESFTKQFVAMVLLGTLLITGAGFYGAHKLATRSFQAKIVNSSHLLRVGTFPTYAKAMERLAGMVPGELKTFPYSSDTTVWFGRLVLFGVAYPDAKGIIRKEPAGFILYQED